MSMRGSCILSHGFESGPNATKVSALAEVAEQAGFATQRPDYTDLDARHAISALGDVPARLQRLRTLAQAAAARGPLVLAGSSLGAWISARVSLEVPVAALLLMAPPVRLDPAPALDAARVPTAIIHGWHDELIAAAEVIAWAEPRHACLLLVNDSHRLSASVEASARLFAELLAGVA